MDVNREDPVEVELAADLRVSALSRVAESTCNTCSGQFNMFVEWYASLAVPRAPLPASDDTVALYLQSVVNRVKTFAPVKATSAAIAFYHRVNLFNHGLTHCPAVCLVRNAAMRRFGLTPKNQKETFVWADVVHFTEAYGVRSLEYCHLVVATMAVIMFGATCRYDDAS